MIKFIYNIYSKYLIETDNNKLIILSNEMKPIHEINSNDIFSKYKINNIISEYNINDNIYKYKIKKNNNNNDIIKLNDLNLDINGNIMINKNKINRNIIDFLNSGSIYKNIYIFTRIYIFNHLIILPEIHKSKNILIPFIGIEIYFKDLIKNKNRKIFKTYINTKNILFKKINNKIKTKIFYAMEKNNIKFNNKIRSIYNFIEEETIINCNMEFIDETKLIKNEDNIYKINKKRRLFSYKKSLFFISLLTLIFIYWNIIFKRKYKFQTYLIPLKEYYLFNAVFDSRTVLIKRYNKNDERIINEIKILTLNLSNSIIKYHLKINNFKTIDLVFSKPKYSLREYVKNKYELNHDYINIKKIYYNDINLFNKLLNSLNELHNSGIIYNNLSPDNIFIELDEVVFCNFEDACFFKEGKCLIKPLYISNIGTKGYRSSEIINKTLNLNNYEACKASDRFSLCIIIYEMVYNMHPFNNYIKDKNINLDFNKIEENIKNKSEFLKWRINIPLHDLVSNAFIEEPKNRYSTNRFTKHPFFWSLGKSFEFIANISDIIENGTLIKKEVLNNLENNQYKVFRNKWEIYLDKEIIEKLKLSRVYNYKSLRSLIRAIRNGGRHYNDNKNELINIYKSFPNGYMTYYIKKFPYLLTTLYYACINIKDHELLIDYFPKGIFKNKKDFIISNSPKLKPINKFKKVNLKNK